MRDAKVIRDEIIDQLATVIDPELGIDVVNLGLIYGIDLDQDGVCLIDMTLTTVGCPIAGALADLVGKAAKRVPEVVDVDVNFVWEPAWSPAKISRPARLALGIHTE